VTRTLDYLPAGSSFLEPARVDALRPAGARAVVIPFGLEASVSYGSGTALGPAAILAASHQLELFDEELCCEPYREYGVATLRVPPMIQPLEAALEQLAELVSSVLDAGKFPFVLGGEHSLTAGAIRPFADRYRDLVVLQFDAHADLRDGYQGERFSHAAAMRRVLDHPGLTLVGIGIRALSQEEAEFLQANRHRVGIHWAHEQAAWDVEAMVKGLAGRPVYLTFDIDALDAGIMPATGTPVPGGLSYHQALAILRQACASCRVVGADLVEFAPIEGFIAYDYTAAALAYKMLSYALLGGRRRLPAAAPEQSPKQTRGAKRGKSGRQAPKEARRRSAQGGKAGKR
jgi:agmatinase